MTDRRSQHLSEWKGDGTERRVITDFINLRKQNLRVKEGAVANKKQADSRSRTSGKWRNFTALVSSESRGTRR